MTIEEELSALKARVAELESTPRQTTSTGEWLSVRRELEGRLKAAGPGNAYPLLTAFGTICRERFRLRNVGRMSAEQAEICRGMIDGFIALAGRDDQQHKNTPTGEGNEQRWKQ